MIRASYSLAAFGAACLIAPLSSAAGDEARASFSAEKQRSSAAVLDLARQFHANVSLPDDLSGYVTVSLHNVTLEQALVAVLEPIGYTFAKRNGVFIVTRDERRGSNIAETREPSAISVQFVKADRAASVLRTLFPESDFRVEAEANAVVAIANPEQLQRIRTVLQSIDVRSPLQPSIDAIALRFIDGARLVSHLQALYPSARFTATSKSALLIRASPPDLQQIKGVIASLDVSPATAIALPGSATSVEGVRIGQSIPRDVARTVAHEFPRLKVSVAGSDVVLDGSTEDVAKAKTLIAQIDQPAAGTRLTQVFRLRTSDAKTVAEFIGRSFPDAQVSPNEELNALLVTAPAGTQRQITEAVGQLDGPANSPGGQPGQFNAGGSPGAGAGSGFEVVTLRSVVPSQGQSGSVASDVANGIVQTLQQLAPNVRVTALSVPGRIALSGDPYSVRQAKDMLAKIDVPAPLVVLDTEILEIDETVANNLGLILSTASVGTTFTEITPAPDSTGQTRLIGIGAITRTPLSLQVQLNLQIQKGNARVLADPRLTTVSGRTASIRAGDTLSILTTAGGGTGTVATTQVVNFQTGVTLDITPIVTGPGEVAVSLHPVVASLTGVSNGVPQISTRDTQTTVHLRNNETLIIGGLIQEQATRTDDKIPLLGSLPLIGGLFRNSQYSLTKNELVIVVTPHILAEGEQVPVLGPPLPGIPTPRPLPTVQGGTSIVPATVSSPTATLTKKL